MRHTYIALFLAFSILACASDWQKPRPVRPYISDGTIVPRFGYSITVPDGNGGSMTSGTR